MLNVSGCYWVDSPWWSGGFFFGSRFEPTSFDVFFCFFSEVVNKQSVEPIKPDKQPVTQQSLHPLQRYQCF